MPRHAKVSPNPLLPKRPARPLSFVDTQVIWCGDCLTQLQKLPQECVDLIYIDPPFNSSRKYETFWGEKNERRAFEDRHESTHAYIDYMRPRCVELARVLRKTGSFYYHCDSHASHYVKVMLDQIFGENCFQNEIIWKRIGARSDAQRWKRENRTKGFFVAFDFTSGALAEIRSFRKRTGRVIVPLTVQEIIEEEEEVAVKLA